MASKSYSHQVLLPLAEQIHQVLIAFFRTSEFGEWQFEESASDQFSLKFRRGNWKTPLFGNELKSGDPERRQGGIVTPRTVPMRLSVRIRPAPKEVFVIVEHEVFLRGEQMVLKSEWGAANVRQWDAIVSAELGRLTEYLQKCFEMPSAPKCIGELRS